jgi:hypothetical protein
MFEEILYPLEMFLQEKINLLPRGDRAIIQLGDKIPYPWIQALSVDSHISTAIIRIWQPLNDYLESSIKYLAGEVVELALAISAKGQIIGLIYILPYTQSSGHRFFSWLAGLPATEADFLQHQTKLHTLLPQSYKIFSSVHDGFFHNGGGASCLKPLEELYFISEMVDETDSLNYEPNQLLAFCGDGAGNEQCYNLTMPVGDGDYATVDWDHEVREISKPQIFWKFVEWRLTQKW